MNFLLNTRHLFNVWRDTFRSPNLAIPQAWKRNNVGTNDNFGARKWLQDAEIHPFKKIFYFIPNHLTRFPWIFSLLFFPHHFRGFNNFPGIKIPRVILYGALWLIHANNRKIVLTYFHVSWLFMVYYLNYKFQVSSLYMQIADRKIARDFDINLLKWKIRSLEKYMRKILIS